MNKPASKQELREGIEKLRNNISQMELDLKTAIVNFDMKKTKEISMQLTNSKNLLGYLTKK